MNKPTAKDLGLPTFEMRVSCGTYCQGGSVEVDATTYPEYTDSSDVWVRGSDVATLSAALDAALAERDKAYGEVDVMRARVAELEKASEAVLDTEGCGCCASEGHSENKLRLRELLKQSDADGGRQA